MVEPGNNPTPPNGPDEPQNAAPRKAVACAAPTVREFVLIKENQRYVFRCAAGDEPQLMAQIATLVREPGNGLTWFDAATLSQQITQAIGDTLKKT